MKALAALCFCLRVLESPDNSNRLTLTFCEDVVRTYRLIELPRLEA